MSRVIADSVNTGIAFLDGVVVTAWAADRFTAAPAYDTATPSGDPDAGPLTTGNSGNKAVTGNHNGGPGQFLLTVPDADVDYWVHAPYEVNGVTHHAWLFSEGMAPGAGEAFPPTTDLSMGSHKITDLADGTADTDAVTKAQLDAVSVGTELGFQHDGADQGTHAVLNLQNSATVTWTITTAPTGEIGIQATAAGGGGSGMANPMTTAGDLIYGYLAGAPSRLAVGTADQVLSVHPSTGMPYWATWSGGGGQVFPPVTDLAMGGFGFTGLRDPVDNDEAVTLGYLNTHPDLIVVQHGGTAVGSPVGFLNLIDGGGVTWTVTYVAAVPAGAPAHIEISATASGGGTGQEFPPTGDLSMGGFKLTALDDGAADTDAATKGQMDAGDAATLTAANSYTDTQISGVSGGGMANPMTTTSDLIVGGSGGTPTRFAYPGDGRLLATTSGGYTGVDPNIFRELPEPSGLADGRYAVTAGGAWTDGDAPSGGGSGGAYADDVGNATDTVIHVLHNLGTYDVVVEVFDNATKETVYPTVGRTSINELVITFTTAPTVDQYRVVVSAGSGGSGAPAAGSITLSMLDSALKTALGLGPKAVQGSGSAPIAHGPDAGLPTGTNPVTVEGWFKGSSFSANDIYQHGDANSGHAFGIRLVDSTHVGLLNYLTYVTSSNWDTSANIADGQWHYLVVTFDGANAECWVDGVSLGVKATSSGGGLNVVLRALTFGSEQTGGSGYDDFFGGSLDEWAVYTGVLSSARIAAHYAARGDADGYAAAVLADNPLRYYHFDESSGANALDAGSQNVTLTYGTGVALGVTGAVG